MGRKTHFSPGSRTGGHRHRLREGFEERLSERGVSVYRPVVLGQLEPALKVLKDLCADKVIIRRGELYEKPTSVSLLDLNTLKNNRELFGEVPTQQAIDEIYNSVISIRQKLHLRLGRIGIFGNRHKPTSTIAYAFEEESAEILIEERLQIIDTLGSLATVAVPLDFIDSYPHISLARVRSSDARKLGVVAWHHLEEAMPQEVILERAILHNPS